MQDEQAARITTESPSRFPEYSPAVLWTLSPLIVSVNGIVVYLILATRQLRITANYFVVSLACCDIIVGAVLIPVSVATQYSAVTGPLIMFTLIASFGMTCACTYDRYVAVIWPLNYPDRLPKRVALLMIAAVWATSVILTLVPQAWVHRTDNHLTVHHRIFICVIATSIIVLTCVQFITYGKILRVARHHIKKSQRLVRLRHVLQNDEPTDFANIKQLLQHIKLSKSFLLVTISFFFFWLPIGYINIADDVALRPDLMPRWIHAVSFYSVFGSSLVNPVLYGIFQRQLRHQFCVRLQLHRVKWTSKKQSGASQGSKFNFRSDNTTLVMKISETIPVKSGKSDNAT